jgi:hypothetical protein
MFLMAQQGDVSQSAHVAKINTSLTILIERGRRAVLSPFSEQYARHPNSDTSISARKGSREFIFAIESGIPTLLRAV